MKEKFFCISTPTDKTYYKAIPVGKEFLDKDNNIVNTIGQLPNGEITEISTESVTVKHLLNGKLHGKLEVINLIDGSISFEEEYEDGVLTKVAPLTDTQPSLFKNNEQSNSGTIVKNSNGRHSFYINGQEVAEETISADGNTLELLGQIPDGEVTEFTENNKKCLVANYKNNKLHGEFVRYNEEEQILSRETYADGVLHGPAEYYTFKDGHTITVKCTYKNSLLEGTRIARHDSGVLINQAQYQQGKLQGTKISYYGNGNKECEEEFTKGKLNGKRQVFFPSEKIWYVEEYVNGKLEGKRTSYFENGILRLEENYSNGLLDGERKEFDATGELLTDEEYHWGTLVHDTEVHRK